MKDEIKNKRKKLIFRSWHRGTREMDLLLGSFADANVPSFTEKELVLYDELLKESDPDLYNWYTEREEPPSDIDSPVLRRFMSHKFAG